ncbi:hypothetical protein DFH09DRAFT_1070517 [Mycena vulgaris]|nr:hypothetical protein DFH09DRAFT_1070517 [Mycena vulgaris]
MICVEKSVDRKKTTGRVPHLKNNPTGTGFLLNAPSPPALILHFECPLSDARNSTPTTLCATQNARKRRPWMRAGTGSAASWRERGGGGGGGGGVRGVLHGNWRLEGEEGFEERARKDADAVDGADGDEVNAGEVELELEVEGAVEPSPRTRTSAAVRRFPLRFPVAFFPTREGHAAGFAAASRAKGSSGARARTSAASAAHVRARRSVRGVRGKYAYPSSYSFSSASASAHSIGEHFPETSMGEGRDEGEEEGEEETGASATSGESETSSYACLYSPSSHSSPTSEGTPCGSAANWRAGAGERRAARRWALELEDGEGDDRGKTESTGYRWDGEGRETREGDAERAEKGPGERSGETEAARGHKGGTNSSSSSQISSACCSGENSVGGGDSKGGGAGETLRFVITRRGCRRGAREAPRVASTPTAAAAGLLLARWARKVKGIWRLVEGKPPVLHGGEERRCAWDARMRIWRGQTRAVAHFGRRGRRQELSAKRLGADVTNYHSGTITKSGKSYKPFIGCVMFAIPTIIMDTTSE